MYNLQPRREDSFRRNTPAPLRRYLRGHQVTRAGELGWQRLVNGRLIKAAEEAGFEVLVTCDQNIHQQQNLRQCKLAIITLSANRWRLLRPVAARIAIEIDFAQAGQIKFIDITAL